MADTGELRPASQPASGGDDDIGSMFLSAGNSFLAGQGGGSPPTPAAGQPPAAAPQPTPGPQQPPAVPGQTQYTPTSQPSAPPTAAWQANVQPPVGAPTPQATYTPQPAVGAQTQPAVPAAVPGGTPPVVPAAPSSPSDPVLQFASQSLGLDTSTFQDGRQMTQRMWEIVQNQRDQIDQLQRMAAAAASAPAQPAAGVAPTQPPSQEWNLDRYLEQAWPVEWKPAYDDATSKGWVVQNQQGAFVPATGHEWATQMAGEMNQAQAGRQQVTQQFGQNPVKFMHDKLRDPIERLVQERVAKALEERFGQFQESQTVDSYESRLAPHVYQHDAQGRQLVDPATGSPAFTPYGQHLDSCIKWFRQRMPDSSADDVMEAAFAVAGQPGAQQAAPAAAAPPAPQAPAAPSGNGNGQRPANAGFYQDQTGGWHRPNGDFASAGEIQQLGPRTFVQNAQAMAQQYSGGGYNQSSLLDTDPDASVAGAETIFQRHGKAILAGGQAR